MKNTRHEDKHMHFSEATTLIAEAHIALICLLLGHQQSSFATVAASNK